MNHLGVDETWDWRGRVRAISERFAGRDGVVLQVGDSLTLAWPNCAAGLAGDDHGDASVRSFLGWAHAGTRTDLDGWHLATVMGDGGMASATAAIGCSTSRVLSGYRGMPPLTEILRHHRPVIVVYAAGTSDVVRGIPEAEYVAAIDAGLRTIEDAGAVPVVMTVAPNRLADDRACAVNRALRAAAYRRRLPLLDQYEELARRADVQSFLEEDGLHLTWDSDDRRPTEASFLRSGYLLRSWLIIEKAMQVATVIGRLPSDE